MYMITNITLLRLTILKQNRGVVYIISFVSIGSNTFSFFVVGGKRKIKINNDDASSLFRDHFYPPQLG